MDTSNMGHLCSFFIYLIINSSLNLSVIAFDKSELEPLIFLTIDLSALYLPEVLKLDDPKFYTVQKIGQLK